MRVHLVQFEIAWEDKPANHAAIRELLSGAAIERDDLVLLPEMFDTGFSINTDATHDGRGASRAFIRDLATDLGVYIQGSITERTDAGALARNCSLTYSPAGALLASYDKLHPFSFGRENERFEGGGHTASFTWAASAGSLTVFPTVCYDLRFPELFRAGVSHGAQAFTVIANWPDARTEHWRTLLRARAIENLAYVFAVNRCGRDPHLGYDGRSAVIAPDGEVLVELAGETGVASVPIDPARVDGWRSRFPALVDRRAFLTPDRDDLPPHRHG